MVPREEETSPAAPRDGEVLAPVRWSDHVRFDDARPTKADLWRGERLLAGLNCLAAGQEQALHDHAGTDKFYLVLGGSGLFEVGGRSFFAEVGALVPAPAGIPHGVKNAGQEPLVLLTVMAPPPRRS